MKGCGIRLPVSSAVVLQEYSKNLGQVVNIVVSHQSLPTKVALVSQLMSALVLPAPEHYRPLLRRFAALGEAARSCPSVLALLGTSTPGMQGFQFLVL